MGASPLSAFSTRDICKSCLWSIFVEHSWLRVTCDMVVFYLWPFASLICIIRSRFHPAALQERGKPHACQCHDGWKPPVSSHSALASGKELKVKKALAGVMLWLVKVEQVSRTVRIFFLQMYRWEYWLMVCFFIAKETWLFIIFIIINNHVQTNSSSCYIWSNVS